MVLLELRNILVQRFGRDKWDIIDLGKVYTDPLYDNRHINAAYTISVASKVG